MFNLYFLRWFSLMGTTLCTAPSKSYAFSTNYHACIAMPTWPRCAPPILFSPWPPYNLLPRLCLTCIFFVDSHWWVPLCVLHPQSYAILTNYHVYMQCSHDIHVHLFCFDFHKFLLRSCAAPTSNCRRGTGTDSDRSLFLALPAERQRSFSNDDSSVVRRRPSSTFQLKA